MTYIQEKQIIEKDKNVWWGLGSIKVVDWVVDRKKGAGFKEEEMAG